MRRVDPVALLGLLAACSPSGSGPSNAADTIYHGGDIVTVNDAAPTAQAVAVRNGRILAVGTEADVMAHRGDATRVVDLEGRAMTPGFVDGHARFMGFGAQAVGANLLAPPDGRAETVDDLVEALREFARGRTVFSK